MHRDIMGIKQMLYRRCHAVGQGNIEQMTSVFHPDTALIIKWEEDGSV